MAKENIFYRIISRSGSNITIRKWDRAAGQLYGVSAVVSLEGYDYKPLRKGVVIYFDGEMSAGNIVYDFFVSPTKLVAITPKDSKKSSKAKPYFEVIKRVGTIIHYRIAGSEHGIDLTLDLKGYTYKSLRKGITFFFENDTIAVENIRYYAFRGATEVKSLLPLEGVDNDRVTKSSKVTKSRGATPNVSILRKHF